MSDEKKEETPKEEEQKETPKEEEQKETPEEKPTQDETHDDEAVKEKEEDVKPSSDSPLEKAETVLKGITEQNDRFEKNLEALKKAQADDLLGGRSLAGKQVTDEEKTKEACKKILPDGMDPFEPPAE